MQGFAALALAALLPACATVVEGTSDTVTLSTTPAGTTCTVDRNGERVAVTCPPRSGPPAMRGRYDHGRNGHGREAGHAGADRGQAAAG